MSRRPLGVSKAIWRAYGDHFPGSYKRWEEQQYWAEQLRRRRARALYLRVHPESVSALDVPCRQAPVEVPPGTSLRAAIAIPQSEVYQ